MARQKTRAKATPAPPNIQLSFFAEGYIYCCPFCCSPLPPHKDAPCRCPVCGQPIKTQTEKAR
nr:MAG TPA: DNA REPAIR HELICASE RAD25, SSL2, PRE-INITIATION COMPLEX, RNA POLYMERASE.0A [Caudoviricetes sp.]